MSTEDKPRVDYWHLWTDPDGISRQTRCAMTKFEKQSIQPTAAPQWLGEKVQTRATVFTTVLPVGWTGDWHENPKPQWIIPLSGRWFVESMDGQRVTFGPGEISFGEDQGTRRREGKQGHLSGAVGETAAVLMIIQVEPRSVPTPPCRFR